MARRRSKWRRTWQTLKKMMQEARKVRVHQSLRQCPFCGNPYSLTITINVDKESDRKKAEVICGVCGFRYEFAELPIIADEFWVYSKVLDLAQAGKALETPTKSATETSGEASAKEPEVVAEESSEEEISVEVEEEPH